MGGRIMAEVSDALGLSNQSEQSEINPYTTENRMVVLLVIICAVISLLGFLSILPWNRIWRSHERERAARLANTGLKKKHIKALPSMVYSKVRSQPDIDIVAECPICLAEFMEGERVRTLPKCRHSFHMECVDKWLLSHSSCPICRHCFLSSDLCIWQNSWMVKGVELQLPEDNLVRTDEEVILVDVEQDNPNPPPPPPAVEAEDLPAESVVIETEEALSDNGAASEFSVDGQIDEGQFQIRRTNEELIMANVE